MSNSSRIYLSFAFLIAMGCTQGFEINPAATGNPSANSDKFYQKDAFGETQLRRLTKFEVKNSLLDIFTIDFQNEMDLLPEDVVSNTHFDNSYESQSISPLIVSKYLDFAETAATKIVTTNGFVQSFAGCTPQSIGDKVCLTSLATKAGRLLLRRILTSAEVSGIVNKFSAVSVEDGKFLTGAELTIRYFLAHPEFIYKIESSAGTNITQLNSFEIASRISFFIWGAGPDEELLLAAQQNQLLSDTNRIVQARRLLSHPRSKRQWYYFHSQWLGYSEATLPSGQEQALLQETNKLLDRVLFNSQENWLRIFNYSQTYVTPQLAQFYNMPNAPNSPGWVNYTGGRGGGILAHGSFLSLGAKFNDTSPTIRGYEIYKRLSCGELGPVPLGVDPNLPPGNALDCKPQRYHMRTTQSCVSCHSITDNIGFGLENFGVFGVWRDVEPNKPNCQIDSRGTWAGRTYSGPAELGQLVSVDPAVVDCSSKQLFRFLMGRHESSSDEGTIQALNQIRKDIPSFEGIILEYIKSPAIQYKKGSQ